MGQASAARDRHTDRRPDAELLRDLRAALGDVDGRRPRVRLVRREVDAQGRAWAWYQWDTGEVVGPAGPFCFNPRPASPQGARDGRPRE